jgi:hypothetical protein
MLWRIVKFHQKNSDQKSWSLFASHFRNVIQTHRGMCFDWDLTDAHIKTLGEFCTANRLLVECLEISALIDREIVENNLLAPSSLGSEIMILIFLLRLVGWAYLEPINTDIDLTRLTPLAFDWIIDWMISDAIC